MTRFKEAFQEPQLVGYLVGNHPSREAFLEYASALIEGGCGVLEVGLPFSDPIADGPTIQQAVAEALEAGVRPREVLDACGQLRQRYPATPLVVMTYANIAHRMGFDAFADAVSRAGVDGVILADMPPEAAKEAQQAFGDDVAQIFLASPASSDARLARLAEATRGFLYVVGLFGTTGAREALDPRTVELVQRVAPVAQTAGVPACVGFGVSTGEQAERLVEAGADGVVVGSAFVQPVLDGEDPSVLGEAADGLAAGVRAGARTR